MPILKVHKTKMQMIAAIDLENKTIFEDKERYCIDYFDLLLEKLNKIILSYMIAKKVEDCHYVTEEMFTALILVRSTNKGTCESEMSIFMLHTRIPVKKEPLSEKEA